MANIKAQSSGNWSDPNTWQGGVLPGPDDVAIANSLTITIDQDITVQRLSNSTFGTSIAGGFFQITTVGSGVTRNILITSGLGNFGGTFIGITGGLLRISATSGVVNLGSTNITSGGASGFTGLLISGSGITVSSTGDVSSAGFNANGVQISGVCTATFNNVFGGSGSTSNSIFISAAANVTVNNVYSGSSPSINLSVSGATLNVLGSVFSSISSNNNLGTISISASNCNLTCYSFIVSGSTPAISQSSNSNFLGNYVFYGPFVFSKNYNASPVYLPNWKVAPNIKIDMYVYDDMISGEIIKLSSSPEGPYPEEYDVLFETQYNSTSGSLQLPLESHVSYGIPVGSNYGTAILTESDVINAEVDTGITLSEKLFSSATISSTGDQISAIGGA